MNHPFIRLFARTTIQWKEKTELEGRKYVEKLFNERIQHEIQKPSFSFKQTNRKLKPFDFEFSYWDWQTIKQMCENFERLEK